MAQTAYIQVSNVPSGAWKNGGGSTKEIAIFPPNAGLDDFIWRVSVAEIKQPSAYSLFPQVDRTQVLIAGPSLTLRNQTGLTKRLLAFQPFSFAGEQDWLAEPEGICQMLNVMTSRTGVKSTLALVRGDFQCVGDGGHDMLIVVKGEFIAKDGSQRFVDGDFVQPALSLGETFALSGSADALMIAIKFSLLNKKSCVNKSNK
jgi:environmental stress-induced protein Ves